MTLPDTYIICEGKEDEALIKQLAKVRGLPDHQTAVIGNTGNPGIDSLFDHLKKVIGVSGFKSSVKKIILVADSDQDAKRAFDKVCTHIRNANGQADVDNFYQVPKAAFRESSGSPTFTVVLLPGPNMNGALETLLWNVVRRLYPDQANCVEAMIECAGIKEPAAEWNIAKRDKARVHSAISILNRHNPAVSISYLWERAPDLIPVEAEEFNLIYAALTS